MPNKLNLDAEDIRKEFKKIIENENISQFKEFAFKNRMLEMAIAFIMGAAFKKVVESIANNLIMPVLNYIIGETGTDWREFSYTPTEGLNLEIGSFLGSFIDFTLISLVLFILYKKLLGYIIQPKTKIKCVDTKDCDFCYSKMYYKCKRCPFCREKIKYYV